LVKPFAFAELLARLGALLRQERSGAEAVLWADNLEVDLLTVVQAAPGSGFGLPSGILRCWPNSWHRTLWNLLGLALMLLALAVLAYEQLRRALYEQVDQQLLGALGQLQQDQRTAATPDERLRYWIHEWPEHENLAAIAYGTGHSSFKRKCYATT
jgi:hypothetical protein